MKLLGFKCDIKCCVLCVLLGMFIGVNWFCSCITKEGMETAGAAVKYAMNKGVPGIKKYGQKPVHNPSDTFEKVTTPLPEGQLFFYANNKFDPKCCTRSTVSGSGGCACETQEQISYLQSRGGNKVRNN
jgi:hypothetical protein